MQFSERVRRVRLSAELLAGSSRTRKLKREVVKLNSFENIATAHLVHLHSNVAILRFNELGRHCHRRLSLLSYGDLHSRTRSGPGHFVLTRWKLRGSNLHRSRNG